MYSLTCYFGRGISECWIIHSFRLNVNSHTPIYSKIRVLRMHVTRSAMIYTGALLHLTKSAGFWSSGIPRLDYIYYQWSHQFVRITRLWGGIVVVTGGSTQERKNIFVRCQSSARYSILNAMEEGLSEPWRLMKNRTLNTGSNPTLISFVRYRYMPWLGYAAHARIRFFAKNHCTWYATLRGGEGISYTICIIYPGYRIC